jgi:hypothetical protein
MLSDKDMLVNTYISVPKEMSGLNCAAFVAGIVEAILTGADFVCHFSSASWSPFPSRQRIETLSEWGGLILYMLSRCRDLHLLDPFLSPMGA